MLWAAAEFTPPRVNAAAYLAGKAPVETFVPQSYVRTCHQGSCATGTLGLLERAGTTSGATRNGQVPLGLSFQVRGPVWS